MMNENTFSLYQWIEIFCFVVGYACIIFEHSIRINKATSALIMAVLLWALKFADNSPLTGNIEMLNAQLANVCQVILFLLCAVSIVEQIQAHGGLALVSRFLKTTSGPRAVFIVAVISFFMSSLLDNLTTTIVMVAMIRKAFDDPKQRLIFGSLVVIAANAGGAWTPIGDVTTTMLWIGGKVTSSNIIKTLFFPSLACLIASAGVMCRYVPKTLAVSLDREVFEPRARTVLACGALSLISVPVFKYLTGLPPFMGILFAMSLMWLLTDLLHKGYEEREHLKLPQIFPKVDMSGILFFLGILLAVGSLEEAGILKKWAVSLNEYLPTKEIVAVSIGVISAIVDNVPLVAASMGMYEGPGYSVDSPFWSLIAYCAGTGGSLLVIGSAAGVAFMGIEKVDFFWYLRYAGPAALAGYAAGIGVWALQNYLMA